MKTYNAVFHTDPGHGWLQVPILDLIAFGIAEKVSGYSYMDLYGEFAYLEEDCDATLFIETLKAKGFKVVETEKYHDEAPWRNYESTEYDSYRPPYTHVTSTRLRDYGKVVTVSNYLIGVPDGYVNPLEQLEDDEV